MTAFFLGPVGIDIDCHIGAIVLECFFCLVISSTLGLSCLRARAIYVGNQLVRTILLTLWLVSVASSLIPFFVGKAVQSSDKRLSSCVIVQRSFDVGITAALAAIVHDTAVFIAVSYQIYRFICLQDHNSGNRLIRLFKPVPKEMLPLWRCMLQDGQLFYL